MACIEVGGWVSLQGVTVTSFLDGPRSASLVGQAILVAIAAWVGRWLRWCVGEGGVVGLGEVVGWVGLL